MESPPAAMRAIAPQSAEEGLSDVTELVSMKNDTNTTAPNESPTEEPLPNGSSPHDHRDHVPSTSAVNERSTTSNRSSVSEIHGIQEHERNIEDTEIPTEVSRKKQIEENNGEKPEITAEQRTKEMEKYGQYLHIMEDRIAWLEKKLQKPKKGEDKAKEDKSTTDQVPTIAELRRVTWLEFKNRVKGDKKVYAIEALVGEEKYYYQRLQERKPARESFSSVAATDQKESVQRIRINSIPILSVLADITDSDIEMEPTVLIYPFKLLVHHEVSIRETLKKLESKWGTLEIESLHGGNKEPRSSNDPSTKADSGSEPQGSSTSTTKSSIDMHAKHDESNVSGKLKSEKEARNSANPDRKKAGDEAHPKVKTDDAADSVEALRDLRCLVQFMDEEITPVIERMKEPSRSRIQYKDLWHLFRPGDHVVIPRVADGKEGKSANDGPGESSEKAQGRHERYQEDWRVLETCGGRRNLSPGPDDEMYPKNTPNPFRLLCYYVDFNGVSFGIVRHSFRIKPFDGEREISSLEVFPSRFFKNIEDRKAVLKARGEVFRGFTTFKHKLYKGPTLDCHPCGCPYNPNSVSPNIESIDSQVVVDFHEAILSDYYLDPWSGHSYTTYAFSREVEDDVNITVWKDNDQDEIDDHKYDTMYNDTIIDDEMAELFRETDPLVREHLDGVSLISSVLREEDLILLPSRILAFVFRNRKFAALHIDHIRPVKSNKQGWSDLKLPSGHKEMLQALVRNHLRDKKQERLPEDTDNNDFDLVRGKGQGLVVLLHGVPGVGKTSTAECVAESNSKPLFPITCGDLGLTAESVERELSTKFHLAQIWDCVLLLDEADVFLAARSRVDVKRNALVSVFLRVLEYYTGILFLTTNRVGAFDGAFKSRIHLPLYFPPLEEDQTISIWKVNLKRTLKRKNGMMTADKKDIISFARSQYRVGTETKANWNGRQIRNAFQTAAALAEFEAQRAEDSQIGPEPKRAVQAKLHSGHFQIVADAALQFDLYLNDIDDNTELDRNDDFDQFATIYSEPKQADGIYKPSISAARMQASRGYSSNSYNDQRIQPQRLASSSSLIGRQSSPATYQERENQQQPKSIKNPRKPKNAPLNPAQSSPSARPRQNPAQDYLMSSPSTPKSTKRAESSAGSAAGKGVLGDGRRRQSTPQLSVENTNNEIDSDEESEAASSESESGEEEEE